MRYAVIACSGCRQAWAIETRHAKVTCPACGKSHDTARRTRLWQGDDLRHAQVQAAAARGTPAELPERMAKHDDPLHAAAAQVKTVRSVSRRATELSTWAVRLAGPVAHDALVAAMGHAGIPAPRAEKEIVRLLAQDHLFEPVAGTYGLVAPE